MRRLRRWWKGLGTDSQLRTVLSVLLVVLIFVLVRYAVHFEHRKGVNELDILIFVFTGFSFIILMATALPSGKELESRKETAQHQKQVAASLERIVALLEEVAGRDESVPQHRPRLRTVIVAVAVLAWAARSQSTHKRRRARE